MSKQDPTEGNKDYLQAEKNLWLSADEFQPS